MFLAEVVSLRDPFSEINFKEQEVARSSIDEDLDIALSTDYPHMAITSYAGFGHTKIPAVKDKPAGYGVCGLCANQLDELHQKIIREFADKVSVEDVVQALPNVSFYHALRECVKTMGDDLPEVYQKAMKTSPYGDILKRELREFKF